MKWLQGLAAICIALGLAAMLLGLRSTEWGAPFAVAFALCAFGYWLLARSYPRRPSGRSVNDSVDMSALASDVREHDRAFRDGTWTAEYWIQDNAPRRIIGWAAVVVAVPDLSQPVFYVLANLTAKSPLLTSVAIVAVALGIAGVIVRSGRARRGAFEADQRLAASRARTERYVMPVLDRARGSRAMLYLAGAIVLLLLAIIFVVARM
jgi:hypothetical protein